MMLTVNNQFGLPWYFLFGFPTARRQIQILISNLFSSQEFLVQLKLIFNSPSASFSIPLIPPRYSK
jgi:hypothetical protein